MTQDTYPVSGTARRSAAKDRRTKGSTLSAENALSRQHSTANNGDNVAFENRIMAFTKGLEHDDYGLVKHSADYDAFVEELTKPEGPLNEEREPYEIRRSFDVPRAMRPLVQKKTGGAYGFRTWESPLAGMTYENQGDDPDFVAMAPTPKLGESELCAEMLEVYAMALVRDMPLDALSDPTAPLTYIDPADDTKKVYQIGGNDAKVGDLITAMNTLNWFKSPQDVTTSLNGSATISALEMSRQRARGTDQMTGALSGASLFRGSTPGCQTGPYLSQFLLQGSGNKGPGDVPLDPKKGKVAFGAQEIDLRIFPNKPGVDWMTTWREWLAVQNGVKLNNLDEAGGAQTFIHTPRDLATYVHIDQLYQAYFVAGLTLLNQGVTSAPGLPEPNSTATREGFATFGGPHLLTLLTEVSGPALRAVRRQKFQIHRRARPERLAAMISLSAEKPDVLGDLEQSKLQSIQNELGLGDIANDITPIMHWVRESDLRNDYTKREYEDAGALAFDLSANNTYLLPMAFPEGSPMHPAYGAGHATVAGACTTVLKAFFDIYSKRGLVLEPKLMSQVNMPLVCKPDPADPKKLTVAGVTDALTIEGELNKLAANIAIGRNFAGVHFYTDYYDSLRMGERVAVSILMEKLVAYPEPVTMEFRSFDNDQITLSTDGYGGVTFQGIKPDGTTITDPALWWTRDTAEFPRRAGTLVADSSNWTSSPSA